MDYGKPKASSDGGAWYNPQAYKFLKLKNHRLHSLFKKSIIKTIQYFKDMTEKNFDDYFLVIRKYANYHVINWLSMFIIS